MAGYTLPQYEKLCAAIASGIMRVRYDAGNEVAYQSGDHMLKIKVNMEKALGLDSAGNSVVTGLYDVSVGVYESGR